MFRSSIASAYRRFAVRPASRVLFDVAVAVVPLAGALLLLRHGGVGPSHSGSGELGLVDVVLAACSTVPLIAWRRFPLGVFVVTASAGVLLAALGLRIDLLLGPAVALYLLVMNRDREASWTRETIAAVVGMLVAYLGTTAAAQGSFPGSELVHTGLAWAVAWFAGERTRLRREHIGDLRERARRVEREAERERLLAVAEERARISRDLHDSAGHAINVIAVRAGAARLRHHQDPDRSLRALEAIEQIAQQTVQEIDHMVGALRQGGAANPVESPTGLASLDTLIAHHEAGGLDVASDISGPPRPLNAAVDQAVYRIVQEALTNAVRHGGGSARVELASGDTAVEITVTNPVLAPCTPPSGRGHGLIGMRERATMLGGTFDAECADGTFHVHARIPYGGHPRAAPADRRRR